MTESVFWGAIVKPGKNSPFVPPPEDAALHISQVWRITTPSLPPATPLGRPYLYAPCSILASAPLSAQHLSLSPPDQQPATVLTTDETTTDATGPSAGSPPVPAK